MLLGSFLFEWTLIPVESKFLYAIDFFFIIWYNDISKNNERQAAFMTFSYENMSRHELEARLHFLVDLSANFKFKY